MDRGETEHLLDQIVQAVGACRLDTLVCPPGDGIGSRALADVLAGGRTKQQPYFEFPSDMRDASGNIVSPFGKPFRYRCPGIHNPSSFDPWTEDEIGDPQGISNW